MNKTNVIPFIKVSLKHLFFNNEKMQDLQIVPNQKTSGLMKKIGVFFKSEGSSIVIGYSQKTISYVEDILEKTMLVFSLKCSNPYFQSITKLPVFVPDKKVIYFNNLNKAANEENITLLHDEDFVSQIDLKNIQNSKLEVRLDDDTSQITFVDPLKRPLIAFKKASEEKRDRIQINLSDASPELFRKIKGEKEEEPFYSFDSQFNHSFGMIHLYFDLEMLKTQGEEKTVKENYEIRFLNRETYWRYYFINGGSDEIPSIKISHPKNDMEFSPPQSKKLINGSTAWEVVSLNLIPLKNNYQDSFTATIKTDSSSNREVPISLPNADFQKIRREKNEDGNDEKMYSDIYVYI